MTEENTAGRSHSEQAKFRILVVEDNQSMLLAVANTLRFEGYEVITASDGEEALSKIHDHEPPDAMVLDLMLPVFDGYHVCRQVRATPQTSTLPIIVTTALGQMDEEQKGRASGADAYLRKPFRCSDLLGQVAAVCRRGKK